MASNNQASYGVQIGPWKNYITFIYNVASKNQVSFPDISFDHLLCLPSLSCPWQ